MLLRLLFALLLRLLLKYLIRLFEAGVEVGVVHHIQELILDEVTALTRRNRGLRLVPSFHDLFAFFCFKSTSYVLPNLRQGRLPHLRKLRHRLLRESTAHEFRLDSLLLYD